VTRIAKRVAALAPSATMAVSERAAKLKAEGHDVVPFSAGEPDRDTPEHIKQAAVEALRQGRTRYTPTAGIPPLRRAIAEKFRRDNGLTYAPEDILVSCGGKHALFNVMQAVIDDGDEVLIPSPYWTSYPEMVKACGGVPVLVAGDRSRHTRVGVEALERAVTPRTVGLVINSPCNPTGAVYPEPELRAIAELARRRNLVLISDEIYEKLIYDDVPHVSPARWAPERTLVVNGVSKTYCMTGWRIGYVAGPRPIIEAAIGLQSQMTSNPSAVAQYAALAALEGPQGFIADLVADYRRRRDLMVERMSPMPGVKVLRPQGALYLFADVSAHYGERYGGRPIRSSMDFCEALLDDGKVAAVPGAAFGDDAFVRLTFSVHPDQIRAGLDRFGALLGRLEHV
jgi:aspartate aminotransferase